MIIFTHRRITEYQREHNEAAVDISAYLSNPINAYLLTKRLTSDWKSIQNVMSIDVGSGKNRLIITLFMCSTIILWFSEK